MALDDLKERLREQALALATRVQETSTWNQIMEKYQDLSPTAQKAALALTGAFAALLLFLIPYSFFSSSQSSMAEFEDKKHTIRELFRVSHAANALPMTPPQVSSTDLRSSVQGVLDTEKPVLLPEQRGVMMDFDATKMGDLPKSLNKLGLMVNLTKLNLDQIVKIGTRLQGLRTTVKMTGMKVQASSSDQHYFDVVFHLVAVNLPVEIVKPTTKPKGLGGK